jgi:hypothetical protein
MASLDRSAVRAQGRVDSGRPLGATQRFVAGFFGVVGTAMKCAVISVVGFMVARLVVHPGVASYAVALALLGVLGFSAFTTLHSLELRRADGRNWLTGLAKPEKHPTNG